MIVTSMLDIDGRSQELGAVAHLTKPLSPEKMTEVLSAALAGSASRACDVPMPERRTA
ncbi:MAG: hypothetical protein QM736_20370 [Vicinamibacterales bacterium]